ncbi:MAG: hypothetical protein U0Q11_26995 [Vicinamibacterales bacterium]
MAHGEDDAHRDGAQGKAFAGGTFSDRLAYDRGSASAGGGPSTGLLPLLLGAAFFAVAAACFWPMAGIGGLGTWMFMRSYIAAARPPLAPGLALLMLFVPSGLGLWAGIKVERWLAAMTWYRRVRYVLRLILTAIFLTYFALTWQGVPSVVEPVTLGWIDRHLTPGNYLFIIVGLVLVHFMSKRFDEDQEVLSLARRAGKKLGIDADSLQLAAIAEDIADDRAKARVRRRAHRLKVGTSIGAVGAVFLMLIGENAGSVIAGFVVFGGLAVVFSRFIPWPLFPRKKPPLVTKGNVYVSGLRPRK